MRALTPPRWFALAAALVVGALPFALLGIALGYWASPRGALPIANVLYLVLAFLGALWTTPRHLPGSVGGNLPARPHSPVREPAVGCDERAPLAAARLDSAPGVGCRSSEGSAPGATGGTRGGGTDDVNSAPMTWELIWMLVILKIPVVYLCVVVWWAIRAKPLPLEPALKPVASEPDPRPGWRFSRVRPPPAPPWAARLARARVREGGTGEGDAVSSMQPEAAGAVGIDTLAGLMSSVAIFLGVLGATDFNLSIDGTHLDARPVRISVAAVVLALIAAGLGGRHQRLAGAAVAIAGAAG